MIVANKMPHLWLTWWQRSVWAAREKDQLKDIFKNLWSFIKF